MQGADPGATKGLGGEANVKELAEAVARLKDARERHAIGGLGAYSADDGLAGGPAANGGADSVAPWRGLNVVAHALIPSFLPLRERAAPRACGRAWRRAAEYGAAKVAWVQALQDAGLPLVAASAAAQDSGAAACAARHMFLAGAPAAQVFQGPTVQTEHAEMKAAGRMKTRQPVVAFGDGTAVALADLAPSATQPDLALMIYDMSTLSVLGSVSTAGAKHGKSVQRPMTVVALQAARTLGNGGPQACVVALQRLVMVFSWQLGASADDEAGVLGVRASSAAEVRWSEKGREALRSATFAGAGPDAPVAVLLEGGGARGSGPVVEVFARAAGGGYALRETVPVSPGGPGSGAIPGTLHGGGLALWARGGERAIDFARIALPPAGTAEELAAAGAGGATSTAAGFARARQSARKGRLRVGDDGAGLDMEASRWGYLVETVDDDPGQPDVAVGDCILSIGGQALHGLDEDVMNWRFGRNIADGVEVTILPAEHMRDLLAADKGQANGGGASNGRSSVAAATQREQCKRQHFVFSARLEAWCVAGYRDPPRLVAVTDNRLVLADLTDDGVMTREAFSGVAKAPWKRPVEQVALLDDASTIVLAAVARGVLVWRVPALAAPMDKVSSARAPELLAAVPMPGRCTLLGASLGVCVAQGAWGWVAADPSGPGSDASGGLDVWRFFAGRARPLLALPPGAAAAGKGPGLAGDAVSRAFALVGGAMDAVSEAARAALGAAGAPANPVPLSLRVWANSLRQDKLEPLYGAVDKAEPACTEAVRDLRRWLRAEGRLAPFARQDGARTLIEWTEECRRHVLWPLQVAFQAEASDDGSDDLPTRPSGAANMRTTGAAAGTVPNSAS